MPSTPLVSSFCEVTPPSPGGRPWVMGIVNCTPDSFSDGGLCGTREAAVAHARRLVEEGADVLDIGGESTRPGASPVTPDEEFRRVLPVIEALARDVRIPISVDTSRAVVAEAACRAGARIVNDVTALRGDPRMAEVVAGSGASVVLMHAQGTPRTMQVDPRYDDVVADVGGFFGERLAFAERSGIARERCVLDPGIGFGKRLEHNLALLAHLPRFARFGRPLLVGVSRKAFLGALTGGAPATDRLEATLAAVTHAVLQGAAIVRVHDVRAVRRAVEVAWALKEAGRLGSENVKRKT